MSDAPFCKLCGAAHWSSQGHKLDKVKEVKFTNTLSDSFKAKLAKNQAVNKADKDLIVNNVTTASRIVNKKQSKEGNKAVNKTKIVNNTELNRADKKLIVNKVTTADMLTKPVNRPKGKTPEARKKYMREYMRKKREAAHA